MEMTRGEKNARDVNRFKHIYKYKQVRAHTERRSADNARPPCLASQPEIVDTFAKVRRALRQGFVGSVFLVFFLSADRVTKVDALGKHLWQGMW